MTKEQIENLWIGDVVESPVRHLKFVMEDKVKGVFRFRLLSDRETATKRPMKMTAEGLKTFKVVQPGKEIFEKG